MVEVVEFEIKRVVLDATLRVAILVNNFENIVFILGSINSNVLFVLNKMSIG